LFRFCDEIIIVDSYSTDKTEIALNFSKVEFIKNKFEDFTKQRNLALKEAKTIGCYF
jgi:glycosyltransferase involved in cell wall biosynthesis